MAVTLVQKYNPEWPRWFEEVKAFLGEKISKACLRIEHVGSTAIPGMTAKPIIDLIIVIEPERFERNESPCWKNAATSTGETRASRKERLSDLSDETSSYPSPPPPLCLPEA